MHLDRLKLASELPQTTDGLRAERRQGEDLEAGVVEGSKAFQLDAHVLQVEQQHAGAPRDVVGPVEALHVTAAVVVVVVVVVVAVAAEVSC